MAARCRRSAVDARRRRTRPFRAAADSCRRAPARCPRPRSSTDGRQCDVQFTAPGTRTTTYRRSRSRRRRSSNGDVGNVRSRSRADRGHAGRTCRWRRSRSRRRSARAVRAGHVRCHGTTARWRGRAAQPAPIAGTSATARSATGMRDPAHGSQTLASRTVTLTVDGTGRHVSSVDEPVVRGDCPAPPTAVFTVADAARRSAHTVIFDATASTVGTGRRSSQLLVGLRRRHGRRRPRVAVTTHTYTASRAPTR